MSVLLIPISNWGPHECAIVSEECREDVSYMGEYETVAEACKAAIKIGALVVYYDTERTNGKNQSDLVKIWDAGEAPGVQWLPPHGTW